MTNKFIISSACVFLFSYAQAQEPQFEFSVKSSFGTFQMGELNSFLTDTSTQVAAKHDSSQITSGFSHSADVSIRFNKFWRLGVEGGVITGKDRRDIPTTFTNIITGETVDYSYYSEIRTSSLLLGLNAGLSIGEVFDWRNSEKWFNRVSCDVSLKFGVAKSRLNDYIYNPYFNLESTRIMNHKSTDPYFGVELRSGYRLLDRSYFSELGFRLGYCYLKTSPLENNAGAVYNYSENLYREVSLDFSGVNFGLYLLIGK